MFTGIVEETGTLIASNTSGGNTRFTFQCEKILADVKLGDSIAVNGLCLTVNRFSQNTFCTDVMPVTLGKSCFTHIKPGDKVNLERALRMSDRLGGHLVTGHIDGVGTVIAMEHQQNTLILDIRPEAEQMAAVIPEGSVCINGISLTVASLQSDHFRVSLIPHTYAATAMPYLQVGDTVNLETDIIGKYVHHFLHTDNQKTLSLEILNKYGFI
ncbi:MAG: riboflavin synthase [Candidatus Cloacimonetes bacterium]|nr:riboflavin synthase [Candidatus Cloacimonadota bacterium]